MGINTTDSVFGQVPAGAPGPKSEAELISRARSHDFWLHDAFEEAREMLFEDGIFEGVKIVEHPKTYAAALNCCVQLLQSPKHQNNEKLLNILENLHKVGDRFTDSQKSEFPDAVKQALERAQRFLTQKKTGKLSGVLSSPDASKPSPLATAQRPPATKPSPLAAARRPPTKKQWVKGVVGGRDSASATSQVATPHIAGGTGASSTSSTTKQRPTIIPKNVSILPPATDEPDTRQSTEKTEKPSAAGPSPAAAAAAAPIKPTKTVKSSAEEKTNK